MIPIRYNVRSLAVRKTTTIATAFGIALVVWVLSSAIMFSNGIEKTLALGGQADVAVVLRNGSDNELASNLDSTNVSMLLGAPGVRRAPDATSGEVVMVVALEKLGAHGVSNVQIRGISEHSAKLRPELKVVEGHAPNPGRDEVMIGKRIEGRFKGLKLGETFELRKNRSVKVVGVFTANGSYTESEVWCDLDVLRAAFGREGSVSSVRVKLDSASAFDGFKASIESDKQYGFMALREPDYLKKQSEDLAKFFSALGTMIAVFCAIGAIIGAMITMYAAVANRQREIGTLRALGFSRKSILLSFVIEAVILAVVGGAVGAVASLAMGLVKVSMMNWASWSEMVFTFSPEPGILGVAMAFAIGMGLLGGFFPALRAASVSPIKAMRG